MNPTALGTSYEWITHDLSLCDWPTSLSDWPTSLSMSLHDAACVRTPSFSGWVIVTTWTDEHSLSAWELCC